MTFPTLTENFRLARLEPPARKVRMVLDTDTYNEIDDQFALVYALLSPKLTVEAVYAAPFHNARSSGPEDGMEKSYEEIIRLLDLLNHPAEGFAFKGSRGYLGSAPQESDAARDLVERALASPDDDPLYVLAIGAITNVASALLMEPDIIKKIVVVWLAGQPLHWHTVKEFNLGQDVSAAQVIFDSGVPMVQIPCESVTTHLLTTLAELNAFLRGQNALCDYLVEIVESYHDDHFAWSKVIWDIVTVAYLLNADWVPTHLVHSPILTDQVTWSEDKSRHLVRFAYKVRRDPIFRDLFEKLRAFEG